MEHTKKINFFVKLDNLRQISSIAHLSHHWYIPPVCAVCLLSPLCRCCMTALLDKAVSLWPDYRQFILRWCEACAKAAFSFSHYGVKEGLAASELCAVMYIITPQPGSCRTSPSELCGFQEELREQCFSRWCNLNLSLPPASYDLLQRTRLTLLGGRSAGWLPWQGWTVSNT